MLLLASSAGASAIGLGEARVLSQLGEPLEVEIPIVTGAGERPGGVSVAVSPEHSPVGVSGLRVEVEESQGLPVRVRLRTREGHREPVVVLRLRLQSSSADIDREYTLLVDPPAIRPAAARKSLAPQAKAPRPLASRPTRQSTPMRSVPRIVSSPPAWTTRQPAPADPGAAIMPLFASVQSPEPGLVHGPVRPGDTLYSISARVAAERGVDQRSVANAILAANPLAFPGGRPERLLAGAMLAVPLSPQVLAGAPIPSKGTGDALASAPEAAVAPAADANVAASAPARSQVAPARRTASIDGEAVSDLRARIAATREAIAAEEARRETLAARLDRANARIENLLARQTELDERQADLADAIASIETRARPAPSLASRVSPVRAAAASTLAPMAPVSTVLPAAPAAQTSGPGADSVGRQGVAASLPGWLVPSPVLALALVAALVAAGLGYRRWRQARESLALDRYRDDELTEVVKQRIADVREEYNRTLSEADDVVIELDEERERRAFSA